MEQSSIIIHKGRKEEKYEIYVEDYVMSFLKEETGTLELAEFHFYGFKEDGGKRYIIYGAGRDKRLAVFDKYDLLEEIGCRLTQAGPVFVVREEEGIYEIKGYEVFYQDNKEMQSYLIDRKSVIASEGRKHQTQETHRDIAPYRAVSLQLGIVLVALVAIVINSTNSYDKMNQLNQSASEVFFAIENQEAADMAVSNDIKDEITVERDMSQNPEQIKQAVGDAVSDSSDDGLNNDRAVSDAGREEDILKLANLENEEQTDKQEETEQTGSGEADRATGDEGGQSNGDKADTSEPGGTDRQEDSDEADREDSTDEDEDSQGVEALSRNVTRYYKVERGDTLYTICQKIYGDTTYVQKICELNQITDPDKIRYGQKIILP